MNNNDVDGWGDGEPMDENFSWFDWLWSFLPEKEKSRKKVIGMIIGVTIVLLSIWIPFGMIALVGWNSWATIPLIATGIIALIGGIIVFAWEL